MTVKDDALMSIAHYLQDTGATNEQNGRTVDEIVDATGLGRRSVYNWIKDKSASQAGILQTTKKKSPYTYYIDNGTLIAYNVFSTARREVEGKQPNRLFTDDTKQAVYSMWTEYIHKAVEELVNPQSIVDGFANALSLNEETLIKNLSELPRPQKVVYGLAFAFQNLSD